VTGPVSLATPFVCGDWTLKVPSRCTRPCSANCGYGDLRGTAAVATIGHAVRRAEDQENLRYTRSCAHANGRHPGAGQCQQSAAFVVGFAAETNSVEQHARAKLMAKNLDMIAANEVGHTKAFDWMTMRAGALARGGRVELPTASKAELAHALTGLIATLPRAIGDPARRTMPPAAGPAEGVR